MRSVSFPFSEVNQVFDCSGNQLADAGARILAKSLQVNAKLETIHLDNNGITFAGYQDLCWALAKNRSVRHIPYPVFDAAASMKVTPEKFSTVFHEVSAVQLFKWQCMSSDRSLHLFANLFKYIDACIYTQNLYIEYIVRLF